MQLPDTKSISPFQTGKEVVGIVTFCDPITHPQAKTLQKIRNDFYLTSEGRQRHRLYIEVDGDRLLFRQRVNGTQASDDDYQALLGGLGIEIDEKPKRKPIPKKNAEFAPIRAAA